MISRMLLAACALLLGSGALVGVQPSGATWTGTSNTSVSVTAANDWAPPTVTLATVPSGVYGTTTITATATDDRSSIASVVLQYAPIGTPIDSNAWTTLSTGCTASSGPSPLTYSCTWDTTSVPDSSYNLRATATDAAVPTAHSATSAVATTLVGNTSSVTFTHVANPLKGSVSLTSTFHRAVSPTAALYFEYLSGGTWTQIPGCYAANANSLTCTWNTTTLADGTYDLRARAFSAATVTDVQSGIVVDNTLPTLDTFTVPAGVLSGTVAMAATATDPGSGSGLASVAFSYQIQGANTWTPCGTDTTAPFSCSLDTTGLTNGAKYVFQAIATDRAGNVSSASTLTRTVSNAPASVAITSPAGGTTLGGTYTIAASASSDRGVTSVEIDARPSGGTWAAVCTDTTAPYSCSWNTTALVGGGYQLQAVLTETYGGKIVTSSPTSVTVDNTAGTVVLSDPTNPTTGTVSGSVSLTATPVSATGVTSVLMQASTNGGSWSTVCTATPFSCVWNTKAPLIVYGTYQLRAVMTQGNGIVVTSSVVTVNVNNVVGSVNISGPAAGNVRGTLNVTANATSNAGVTSVQLEMRSTPNGAFAPLCAPVTVSPYTCSWNTAATRYGTFEVRAVMTQGDKSTITSAAVAVAVDNRVLGGVDVQTTNAGTAGTPSVGDTLTLTYSGLVDLSTIKTGMAYGTGIAVALQLTGTNGNTPDRMDFTDASLGSVSFVQNFVGNRKTIVFTGSTMMATQGSDANGFPVTVITVTLGTPGLTPSTSSATGNMIWTPSAATKDLFAVASTTTAAIESGLSDLDL